MKPVKGLKNAHSSNSKMGSGDFYGTAIKQNVGRIRDSYMKPLTSKSKIGKPPKSLA
jgi:hypothetical protein